jgi:hypothetical protein
MVCLHRRVRKALAVALWNRGKFDIPKRGTLKTPMSAHTHEGTGGKKGTYDLITTLAGLNVTDFTHVDWESTGSNLMRRNKDEEKGRCLCVSARILCVCVCVCVCVWWTRSVWLAAPNACVGRKRGGNQNRPARNQNIP